MKKNLPLLGAFARRVAACCVASADVLGAESGEDGGALRREAAW